jgi:nucleotide-binding universal stress UspA family protein
MKTILVALDFSEYSKEVEKVGYEMAKALGASVTLITVVNKSLDYTAAYFTGLTFSDQWEERLYLAQQKLEEVKNNHPDVTTHIISFIGYPKKDIIEAASDPDVCYVVVGTHGRTGISNMIMGGTTAFLVQHSVKPVIVVPFKTNRH